MKNEKRPAGSRNAGAAGEVWAGVDVMTGVGVTPVVDVVRAAVDPGVATLPVAAPIPEVPRDPANVAARSLAVRVADWAYSVAAAWMFAMDAVRVAWKFAVIV